MKQIEYYTTADGKTPYTEWYNSLDRSLQYLVDKRMIKIKRGLYGDYRQLSDDLFEFKFHNGLRIYFTEKDDNITIILLTGGNKSKQSKDIEKANSYLLNHKERYK